LLAPLTLFAIRPVVEGSYKLLLPFLGPCYRLHFDRPLHLYAPNGPVPIYELGQRGRYRFRLYKAKGLLILQRIDEDGFMRTFIIDPSLCGPGDPIKIRSRIPAIDGNVTLHRRGKDLYLLRTLQGAGWQEREYIPLKEIDAERTP